MILELYEKNATCSCFTVQKMKFFIKDFFNKCDQIHRKLRTWSHLLKKSFMENLIFCAVVFSKLFNLLCDSGRQGGVVKLLKHDHS